jgi:DNA repair exonuclease SbcCD ATPase subunit
MGSKKEGGDVTASSPSVAGTPASLRVDALKARITQLRARETELTKQIERDRREQAEVQGPPTEDRITQLRRLLRTQPTDLTKQIERDHREQAAVREALAEVEERSRLRSTTRCACQWPTGWTQPRSCRRSC